MDGSGGVRAAGARPGGGDQLGGVLGQRLACGGEHGVDAQLLERDLPVAEGFPRLAAVPQGSVLALDRSAHRRREPVALLGLADLQRGERLTVAIRGVLVGAHRPGWLRGGARSGLAWGRGAGGLGAGRQDANAAHRFAAGAAHRPGTADPPSL